MKMKMKMKTKMNMKMQMRMQVRMKMKLKIKIKMKMKHGLWTLNWTREGEEGQYKFDSFRNPTALLPAIPC